MNTMNMPGFTAEASLSKQGKFYRLPATYVSDSFGVQPQLRKTDYECVHDCLEAGGGDICNFFCTENVDPGGGGGGGQQCRPSCGPCQRDPDSRTGRSRLCIDAKCDDYTKRC
jgi:hypothetical protein